MKKVLPLIAVVLLAGCTTVPPQGGMPCCPKAEHKCMCQKCECEKCEPGKCKCHKPDAAPEGKKQCMKKTEAEKPAK